LHHLTSMSIDLRHKKWLQSFGLLNSNSTCFTISGLLTVVSIWFRFYETQELLSSYFFYLTLFSRTHKRAAYHYIRKKKKGDCPRTKIHSRLTPCSELHTPVFFLHRQPDHILEPSRALASNWLKGSKLRHPEPEPNSITLTF
jgi:hypothetical protein